METSTPFGIFLNGPVYVGKVQPEREKGLLQYFRKLSSQHILIVFFLLVFHLHDIGNLRPQLSHKTRPFWLGNVPVQKRVRGVDVIEGT